MELCLKSCLWCQPCCGPHTALLRPFFFHFLVVHLQANYYFANNFFFFVVLCAGALVFQLKKRPPDYQMRKMRKADDKGLQGRDSSVSLPPEKLPYLVELSPGTDPHAHTHTRHTPTQWPVRLIESELAQVDQLVSLLLLSRCKRSRVKRRWKSSSESRVDESRCHLEV